jgi:hypothetical protein
MIKNINSVEDKLSSSSNVTLHCEINFVQCATSLNNSDIQISSFKKYNNTCLHLCDSKVRIIDNVAKIMIKKTFLSFDAEIFVNVPLTVVHKEIVNNVSLQTRAPQPPPPLSLQETSKGEVEVGKFKLPLFVKGR